MTLNARMAEALTLVRAGQPMAATRVLQGQSPAPVDEAEYIDIAAEPAAASGDLQMFRSRHGDLGYRLHRPASLAAGAPLLVMLHGCTQTAADFALGTQMNDRAAAAGFAVLWPEQSTRANPRRCWRWFDAAHQQAATGEAALLLALIDQVAADHQLDASAIFVAGLSAGGAMAAVLADCASDRVRAVAVHSGLAAGAAGTMAAGLSAMQTARVDTRTGGRFVPMMVMHGDADTVVAPGNADALFDGAVARAGGRLSIARPASRWGRLTTANDAQGHVRASRLLIAGAGHAWSGGDPAGSYTSSGGPDASAEILRFFEIQRAHPAKI